MTTSLPTSEFEALRHHLLEHSVKRGDFVLKSGRRSNWFIDSKQTVCRPEAMLLVADAVLSVLPDDATAIGGLTMGADPVAFVTAGVAATRGRLLKAFSVRKEAKDHGGGGRIAGALDPGDRAVVTEDTVTRGTSLLEAAGAVQEVGSGPRPPGGGGGPGRHGRGHGRGRRAPVPGPADRARPGLRLRGGRPSDPSHPPIRVNCSVGPGPVGCVPWTPGWWVAGQCKRVSTMACSGQATTHKPQARQSSARGV